jgi:hypothetical protein
VLEGERGGGRAGRDVELAEDVLQVAGDGVLADDERRSDLTIRSPGRDEAKDLELSGREPVP